MPAAGGVLLLAQAACRAGVLDALAWRAGGASPHGRTRPPPCEEAPGAAPSRVRPAPAVHAPQAIYYHMVTQVQLAARRFGLPNMEFSGGCFVFRFSEKIAPCLDASTSCQGRGGGSGRRAVNAPRQGAPAAGRRSGGEPSELPTCTRGRRSRLAPPTLPTHPPTPCEAVAFGDLPWPDNPEQGFHQPMCPLMAYAKHAHM